MSLCFVADPAIYLFPRKRELLFTENNNESDLQLVTLLGTYPKIKDSYKIDGENFNQIDKRIYVDLGKEWDGNTIIVNRVFSIGYLKKEKGNLFYKSEFTGHNHSIDVISECSDEDISTFLVWNNSRTQRISNEDENTVPIMVHPLNYDGKRSVQNITLCVCIPKNKIINNIIITIKARKTGKEKWSESISFCLYRNSQNNINSFKRNKKGQDTDFFVIPSYFCDENQQKILKQIKILNNQVFSRNKKMASSFCYVKEDGELDDVQQLMNNIRNSIEAFKTDSDDEEKGCRSGKRILKDNVSPDIKNIECNYPYNFDNYGHNQELLVYLSETYSRSENELQGLVVDRNFLFGNYKAGDSQDKIEGVMNLYEFVVVPFLNSMIQHAESYLNFNTRWLSCPKYNNNYQRGDFTIPENTTKQLLKSNGETEILSAGSVIAFKPGADLNAFNVNTSNYYEILSVNGDPNKNGKILLDLSEKKLCDDRKDVNYSDYAKKDTTITDSLDKNAINEISSSNGIPYYMNRMDSSNNVWSDKLKTDTLLGWSENKKNWYLYENKPNTGSFGIDCSGLVSNSISRFQYDNKIYHFTNNGNYFQKAVDCSVINSSLVRRMSAPLIQNNGKYIIKNGDCLICDTHIVLVDTQNNEVTVNDYNNRKLTVIHSFFGFDGNVSTITLLGNNTKYKKGYWSRTLKGPYRHAGITIGSTRIGRFYLWF